MQIGEATNLQHRYLPLNVTDRNRIEEFGKQEFFGWVRHSKSRHNADVGDINNCAFESLRRRAKIRHKQGIRRARRPYKS